MSIEWPQRLLTLQDWRALPPDDPYRLELVEGVLLKVARPTYAHQRLMLRLGAELDRQLPVQLPVVADVEVVLSSGEPSGLVTVRVPDLVILRESPGEDNPPRFTANEVLVAIEIVSPGTGRTDRVMKMAEYAEFGIPHYWILELGPPARLSTYVLPAPGEPYVAGTSGGGTVVLTEPAPLSLDLDVLTSR